MNEWEDNITFTEDWDIMKLGFISEENTILSSNGYML